MNDVLWRAGKCAYQIRYTYTDELHTAGLREENKKANRKTNSGLVKKVEFHSEG